MTIAETAMREQVQHVFTRLTDLLASAESERTESGDNYAGFIRGNASAYSHALEIVRQELAEWLPCACGKPSIGPDITGAQMCSRCADQAAHAIEETGLNPAGMIPTQSTGEGR